MADSPLKPKKPEDVPLIKAVLESKNPKKGRVSVELTDPFAAPKEGMTLSKAMTDLLDGPGESIERLAFEVNPRRINIYSALYRIKEKGLPDDLLKRISIQD